MDHDAVYAKLIRLTGPSDPALPGYPGFSFCRALPSSLRAHPRAHPQPLPLENKIVFLQFQIPCMFRKEKVELKSVLKLKTSTFPNSKMMHELIRARVCLLLGPSSADTLYLDGSAWGSQHHNPCPCPTGELAGPVLTTCSHPPQSHCPLGLVSSNPREV